VCDVTTHQIARIGRICDAAATSTKERTKGRKAHYGEYRVLSWSWQCTLQLQFVTADDERMLCIRHDTKYLDLYVFFAALVSY